MKKTFIVSGLVIMWSLCMPLSAQDSDTTTKNGVTEGQGKERFWEVNVSGGQYVVALGNIISVSLHQYILDGALVVDEVTVDTTGQALVRFYYITPITDEMRGSGIASSASRLVERGKELVEQGADRTGTQIQNMVVKQFPHTTHARQIEYRVLSAEALGAIYGSAKRAWETGRGRVCTVR